MSWNILDYDHGYCENIEKYTDIEKSFELLQQDSVSIYVQLCRPVSTIDLIYKLSSVVFSTINFSTSPVLVGLLLSSPVLFRYILEINPTGHFIFWLKTNVKWSRNPRETYNE